MKRLLVFVVLWLPLLVAGQARTSPGQPFDLGDYRLRIIDDPVRVDFPAAAPDGLSKERIRDAMRTAAGRWHWNVVADADERIELTRTVEDMHRMNVEISYDLAGYTVRYLDSAKLLYEERSRGDTKYRVIHGSYNGWVRELILGLNNGLGLAPDAAKGGALAWTSAPQVSPGESGKVLIVRKSSFVGAGVAYALFIDGEQIAELLSGDHTELDVPAGLRQITAKCPGPFHSRIEKSKQFTARAGGKAFFVVSPPQCELESADQAIAQGHLSGSRAVRASRDGQPRTALPADIAIIQPAPNVPAATAAYSGVWIGKWARMYDHTLIVERIEGSDVLLVYSLNPDQMANSEAQGWRRVKGSVDRDGVLRAKLQSTNGPVSVSYKVSADGGKLEGERQRKGGYSSGTFVRGQLP